MASPLLSCLCPSLRNSAAHRGIAQRGLDAVMAVIAADTDCFLRRRICGTTLVWLVFGLALGFVGIALAGLTLHEVESWREAHDLGELHWLAPADRRGGHEVGEAADRVGRLKLPVEANVTTTRAPWGALVRARTLRRAPWVPYC